MSSFYVLFLSWLIILTIPFIGTDSSDDEIERGNAYIDDLLKDMFEDRVHIYDPYFMEDSTAGFTKQIAFVNVTGEAKLFNGRIVGLRTLHRMEDCSMTEDDGRLHVRATLGAGVLKLFYEGTVRFMNLGPTIEVHGVITYVEVDMEFSVDSATGRNGTLDKFVIDDLRGIQVWISGLGPLNWAVNPILKGVTKIFQRKMKNLLESKVERHISEKLPNFQFPVVGIKEQTVATDASTTQFPVTEEEDASISN